MRSFLKTVGVAMVIAGLVSACGDDKIRPTLLAPSAPSGAVISALDNTFSIGANAAVGTEVKFVNNGRNDHNIVVSDGPDTAWGVGKTAFGPGAEYIHTFAEPGTYSYFCSIHGTAKAGMIGTITVTGPNGEIATETTVAVPVTTVPVVTGSAAQAVAPADADG